MNMFDFVISWLVFGALSLSEQKQWRKLILSNPPPTPRYGHVAIVCKGSIFIMGGKNAMLENLSDMFQLTLGMLIVRRSLTVIVDR